MAEKKAAPPKAATTTPAVQDAPAASPPAPQPRVPGYPAIDDPDGPVGFITASQLQYMHNHEANQPGYAGYCSKAARAKRG
jgi:hypothetical protein